MASPNSLRRLNRATRAAASPGSTSIGAPSPSVDNVDEVQRYAQFYNDLGFQCGAYSQDAEDLKRLLPQIEATMPAVGGVLVVRLEGAISDAIGGVHRGYIGLIIGGRGATKAEAVADYERRKTEAEEKPTPFRVDMCYPEDTLPKGNSKTSGATMSAAPPGYDANYARKVAENFQQYAAKTAKNMAGGATVGTGRYIFVDRKALEKIKSGSFGGCLATAYEFFVN